MKQKKNKNTITEQHNRKQVVVKKIRKKSKRGFEEDENKI